MVMVSCLFQWLVVNDWMPGIVDFTLLGAGCFYILINIDLCSEMQLNYLKQLVSFGCCF